MIFCTGIFWLGRGENKVIIECFKLLRIKTVAIASIIILIDAMATAIR